MSPERAGRRAAIIDVDGTLIRNTTCERQLIRHALRNGCLGIRNLVLYAGVLLPSLFLAGPDRMRQNRMYYRGVSEKKLLTLIPSLYDERLAWRLRPSMHKELSRLKEEDYMIILLSGTPTFILEELGKRLGIGATIGTELEVKGGIFTGRISGLHPHGERKPRALETSPFRSSLDLSRSIAYGDSWQDRFLLERVGEPVAVSPDRRLAALAGKRGWRIIPDGRPDVSCACEENPPEEERIPSTRDHAQE